MEPEKVAKAHEDGAVDMVETKDALGHNRLAPAQLMSKEEFEAAEKQLKKKLDMRLLACVWLIFVLNYLDRNNIAAAKVAGMAESLDLSANQYATAVAILFVGYVLMQIPSNVFLANLRPSVYLPGCMAMWGLLSTLTGVVHTPAGLYALRFFLGFVEAAFYPGALFLISSWYRRSELGLRSAVLFSATQLGSAFGGLIGAGIKEGLEGARGLESWRWLFLIEGSVTVSVALCSVFVLPDWPSTTRWLTPTERAVAEWRLVQDAGQVDEDAETWTRGFGLAFGDWRVYVFAAMFFCLQVAAATSNFFPSVVQTLGYDRVVTLLLTAPPYVLGLVVSVANNWSADRMDNSSFHVMWPLALAIVGFVVAAAATTQVGPRYFAMLLMVGGGHGANAVVLAWAQKTMLRPRIKRAAAVAFVNAFGNISQVWTSYLYPDSDKPRYVLAMSVNSAFAFGTIVLAFVMRVVLQRANKKLESGVDVAEVMKGESQAQVVGVSEEDREANRARFRYVT
ncbi:putative transporter [Colletotrichum sidae]|uniref:Putative transporter n=1 Tax=Colletotrichum sidae TaxID=1347389 RepID=A0A4R8TQU1_9PEZI|nr:putative transporter [Colletotrichum sidae]